MNLVLRHPRSTTATPRLPTSGSCAPLGEARPAGPSVQPAGRTSAVKAGVARPIPSEVLHWLPSLAPGTPFIAAVDLAEIRLEVIANPFRRDLECAEPATHRSDPQRVL